MFGVSDRKAKRVVLFLCVLSVVVLAVHEIRAEIAIRKKLEGIHAMEMKTACVGRMVLDVPKVATVEYMGTNAAGWDISADPDESNEEFEQRLVDTEAELKAVDETQSRRRLEQVLEIKEQGRRGKIYIYDRGSGYEYKDDKKVPLHWIAMQALFRVDDVSFTVRSELRDETDVGDLRKMVMRLRPRNNDEVPNESGFCFNRAILLDPFPRLGSESTAMSVAFPGHPDAHMVVAIIGGIAAKGTLLERNRENDVMREYASRFHVFRADKRTIAEMDGDEIIRRVRELNNTTVRSAFWVFPGVKDNYFKPFLSVEFRTGVGRPGEPVDSSFSDKELISLWDKILSTLRVRPVKDASFN